jgi:hypothetical protein
MPDHGLKQWELWSKLQSGQIRHSDPDDVEKSYMFALRVAIKIPS